MAGPAHRSRFGIMAIVSYFIVIYNWPFFLLLSFPGTYSEFGSDGINEATSDGNSDHNSSGDEDSQLRLRLKRKLQRNRTSFSTESSHTSLVHPSYGAGGSLAQRSSLKHSQIPRALLRRTSELAISPCVWQGLLQLHGSPA